MKSLAVRVLGDFGVDGVEPQTLGSRKARQALHILALGQGHAVPVGVLTDALWDDARPARPEDQIAVLMSRLRSVLGRDRIEHRDHGYVLRYDWLDAAELAAVTAELERRRQAGASAGAAVARVALSLVRGAEPTAAAVAGDWVQLRLSELERLVRRARLAASAALLDAGDWTGAVDAAAAVLERDPYSEAALRLLLRAYVAGGQVAEALAAYERTRERLAGDLGTDPSPETSALFTAILRGELTAPEPRPASGPGRGGQPGTDPAGVVGRGGDLRTLDEAADRARDRRMAEIVLVQGEAGIGKTTLLRAWAGQRTAVGDTVLIASCSQLDRSMPLDAILTALAGLLRRLGQESSADLLGADAVVLGPMLGLESPARAGLPPRAQPYGRYGPMLGDAMLGPAAVYSALARLLGRLAEADAGAAAGPVQTRGSGDLPGPLVVIIDDAHLAGQALPDWLRFVQRENIAVVVVAAVRAGEPAPLPAGTTLQLGALGREAVAELVGATRAADLYERSKGHPLFLSELAQQLAQQPGVTELPASLVESVSARCDELGRAGTLLRTAAVIGQELDIDLLAAVLARPVVDLLDDAERAVALQFLAQDEGTFRFRHELLMQALAASASAGRAALLHRQAGRVLARRADADPVTVARHARLGGDTELAAKALRDAAARAAERFDHAAAEALLDDALGLRPEDGGWLERARVRTRRGHYEAALADVERASSAGAAALEVGAWASYFGREFAQAAQFAEDGALAAAEPAMRARCLAVGGRTRHASGDLAQAEQLLGAAFATAEGADRVTAAAWLGVLRSHQSRTTEALSLLRPAARGQIGVEHTAATLHALLFTGHSQALAGSPAAALEVFSRYSREVDRRQVPRFAGRAENFSGWVLRNLAATSAGMERHYDALETGRRNEWPELQIAALEDLAEQCIEDGDLGAAQDRLAEALALLTGDLVFGWRLDLKHALLRARLALACDQAEQAGAEAAELERRAAALGVPRYLSVARLLRHRAERALGAGPDPAAIAADLEAVEASVAIEAWRWTAATAAEFGSDAWRDRAAAQADRLAARSGPYADGLRAAAARRLG